MTQFRRTFLILTLTGGFVQAQDAPPRPSAPKIALGEDVRRVLESVTASSPLPPIPAIVADIDLAADIDFDIELDSSSETAAARRAIESLPVLPPLPPMPPVIADIDLDIELDSLPEIAAADREVSERTRAAMEDARRVIESLPALPPLPPMPALPDMELHMELHSSPELAGSDFALLAQAMPPPKAPTPAPAPGAKVMIYDRGRASDERLYASGTRYLDRREWDRAVEAFSEAAERKGAKADGALYWKAYALSKLGRRDEALAAIAELERSHSSSRWLNDAKALQVEIKQAGGQGVSPENQADEDLKLMAINSLMGTDPDRAVPLLGQLLNRTTSPRLRERALFVLAQSRTPQAQEIVVQFAKGKGNPDLQMKAVEYLGIHGGGNNLQILTEVYSSSQDANLKRRILHSYMVAGDKDRLFQAAKSEPNPELRREAIQQLGNLGAYAELNQLYSGEQSTEVKESLLHAFFVSGNSEKLVEIARNEKDPKVRRQAIHRIGNMRKPGGMADLLVSLYGTESDKSIKREIIHSLSNQNDAPRIIELARKETDPELKREAVQRLAHMKTKEATDFLMEILNK